MKTGLNVLKNGISKLAEATGNFAGDKILRPIVEQKKIDLLGVEVELDNQEVFKNFDKNTPIIIAVNHIGPIEEVGKTYQDSGLTPDVLLINQAVEKASGREPLLIGGVNDELLFKIPALRFLTPIFEEIYYKFGSGFLASLDIVSVNKLSLRTLRSNSGNDDTSNFMSKITSLLNKGNIMINFCEGVWRKRYYNYSAEGTNVNSGTGRLAEAANAIVIPAFIMCSEKWADLHDVTPTVIFGSPISPTLKHREIRSQIGKQIQELQVKYYNR